MVCRIAGNEHLADEILQDVFMRLWAKASIYRPADGELATWLTVVARNLALDTLRRNSRWRGHLALDDAMFEPALEQPHRDRDLAILVRDALMTLSADQRRTVELAYFAGMSHSELAEHFDQPLGTVKSRLRLALVKLRDAVAGTRTKAKVSR
jgi:RNA polymerase sigma-70 factor (ECF subfamily)